MIVNAGQLRAVRERHQDEKIVFAHGAYDLLHYGHLAGLTWAKQQGDKLVVGVSTDARIRQRKGPARPIINQINRLTMVDALKVVDYAVLTEGPYDPAVPISLLTARRLQPDVIVLSDQCSPEEESVWRSALANTAADIIRHPDNLRLISTSEIIKRIKES